MLLPLVGVAMDDGVGVPVGEVGDRNSAHAVVSFC